MDFPYFAFRVLNSRKRSRKNFPLLFLLSRGFYYLRPNDRAEAGTERNLPPLPLLSNPNPNPPHPFSHISRVASRPIIIFLSKFWGRGKRLAAGWVGRGLIDEVGNEAGRGRERTLCRPYVARGTIDFKRGYKSHATVSHKSVSDDYSNLISISGELFAGPLGN